MAFPPINYKYWVLKNPFYKNVPITESIRTCILHYASKQGLINDVYDNISTITCSDLVNLIKKDIELIIFNDLFDNDTRFLRVFDLIQAWGGKMGKAPYVPFKNPSRNTYEEWINDYKRAVKLVIEGNHDAIKFFLKVPKIGESFGTKHLHFWSRFGAQKYLPIYDKRIKTLLYNCNSYQPSYNEYLKDITQKSKLESLSIIEIEMALFAFSINYFPNEKLEIKDKIIDKRDIEIAISLQNEWRNCN